MSRKNALYLEIEMLFKSYRVGAYRSRDDAKYLMRSMVNDLIHLKRTPAHLNAIQAGDIKALVRHWQKKGCGPRTIRNKLGKLRSLCKQCRLSIELPSNAAMNIVRY